MKNSRLLKILPFVIATLIWGCDNKNTPINKETFYPPRYTESIRFESKILQRVVYFSLYLPAEYTHEEKRYSTIYLLHGLGDNEKSWNRSIGIESIVEELEKNGKIEPMIYVMPQGYDSYYVDKYNNSAKYMQMFVNELVPYIDRVYRTIADAKHRAVIGYSMGGYGAFIIPFKNPDIFSISVPLSMSWRTHKQYCSESQNIWNNQFGSIFGGIGLTGTDRLTPYYLSNDPFTLFATPNLSTQKVHYLLDSGDDEEQITIAQTQLHDLMRANGISHQMRIKDGAHTTGYWRTAMQEALPFVQSTINNLPYPQEQSITIPNAPYSGEIKKCKINDIEITIALPKGYNTKSHIIYFAYSCYKNAEKELADIRLVFDSIQQKKNCILVEIDITQKGNKQLDYNTIYKELSLQYNLCTHASHAIFIGNKEGGKWAISESFTGTGTDQPLGCFLFEAQLPNPLPSLSNTYYYLSSADEGDYNNDMSRLYIKCKTENKDFEYRIYNGLSSFNSLIYGLQQSFSYMGSKLNVE